MIIDKTSGLWTPEEVAERDVEKNRFECFIALVGVYPDNDKYIEQALEARIRLNELHQIARHRYKEQKTPEQALEDAIEVIEALTEQDYLEYLKFSQDRAVKSIDERLADIKDPEKRASLEHYYRISEEGSFEGARDFVDAKLYLQREVIVKEEDEEARQALLDELESALSEKARDLYKIQVPIDTIIYPLDKVNQVIWRDIEDNKKTELRMEGKGRNKKATLEVKSTFDEENFQKLLKQHKFREKDFDELVKQANIIGMTKNLTIFDKVVYIAVYAVWNTGNAITLRQIHFAMTDSTMEPSTNQLDRIYMSLMKMSSTKVFIDNAKEISTFKGYGHFYCPDEYLLMINATPHFINGEIREQVFIVREEPVLMRFARERSQITQIPAYIWGGVISSGRKTIGNLDISDYLVTRISRMKHERERNKRASTKILLDTLYERCGIIQYKQKSRAPQKIEQCLTDCKEKGWIRGYTMNAEKGYVTIRL